jgi:16S rRNA (cytosine967-C5)-methyltransferase
LDETIDRYFSSSRGLSRYKPLIYEITSGVIRWKLYLDWVLNHFVREGVKRDVRYLLWMSLYQAFFMHKTVHHVVNETVDYVKAEKGQGTANFVNAVIRRSLREREILQLPPDLFLRLSIEYSFPRWLVERWQRRFGTEGLRELLALLNKSPEFALRIDLRKTTRDVVAASLAEAGVRTRYGRLLQTALYVDRIGPVLDSDLLAQRLIHVQDETSQMAGHAMAASAGYGLVLDACAGQGTKTDQIREEVPDARVIALDIDGKKLRSIRATNCLIRGDVFTNPFKTEVFDSILLDAPCSSLGIIRKHPEIRWRRSETDIAQYGGLQAEMIRSLSVNLKRGGALVYSVCSFEPEETVEVVERLTGDGRFSVENPLPGLCDAPHFLSVPHITGMDGFFVATLRKL